MGLSGYWVSGFGVLEEPSLGSRKQDRVDACADHDDAHEEGEATPKVTEPLAPAHRFRLEAHRLLDLSTQGLRVIKKQQEKPSELRGLAPQVRVWGSKATRDEPFAPALVAQN